MTRSRPPIIIDIEASGFGGHSYPIEVGVALKEGAKFCALVQPERDWTHWDEEAERVHRVSRDVLETHGRPIAEIARELNDLLRGRTVFSDGWVVDKTWLDRLFHAAGVRREFHFSALEMILSEPQMAIWHPTKDDLLRELGQRRHRASFDAYVVQETYERTWKTANGAR